LNLQYINEKRIAKLAFNSTTKFINITNNTNIFNWRYNHFDCLIKAKMNLTDILTFKNSNCQVGLFYRNSRSNYLISLNMGHSEEDPSLRVEDLVKDNKFKFGFIKLHSFSKDLEAVFGSRMNFIFEGLGNDFELKNIKASAGVISKDASAFLHFTKPYSFPLEKIRANFLVNLFPGLNMFGEAKYMKNNKNKNKNHYKFTLGHKIEIAEKSDLKVKITNQKKVHFSFKRELSDKLNLIFMGNFFIKESARDDYGKIDSNFGFNIFYTG